MNKKDIKIKYMIENIKNKKDIKNIKNFKLFRNKKDNNILEFINNT